MIPRLLAAGHAVAAMTRDRAKAESLERAGADAVVCDVFDGPGLTAAVRSAAPAAIIHQLTDLPAAMNPRRLTMIYEGNNRVRREGTENLIAAGRAAGVSRIVVQSMGTWYRRMTPVSREARRSKATLCGPMHPNQSERRCGRLRRWRRLCCETRRSQSFFATARSTGLARGTGPTATSHTGAQAAPSDRGFRPRRDVLHPHRRRGVGRRRGARRSDLRRLQHRGQ